MMKQIIEGDVYVTGKLYAEDCLAGGNNPKGVTNVQESLEKRVKKLEELVQTLLNPLNDL